MKEVLTNTRKILKTSCILSDHNGIKLEIQCKRNLRTFSNTWRLEQHTYGLSRKLGGK
jgi:hypothetical protein